MSPEEIAAAVREAVLAEREACIRVALDPNLPPAPPRRNWPWEACDLPDAIRESIAAAIRGRGV